MVAADRVLPDGLKVEEAIVVLVATVVVSLRVIIVSVLMVG